MVITFILMLAIAFIANCIIKRVKIGPQEDIVVALTAVAYGILFWLRFGE